MELDHIVLWVEDVARALDFYEKVLGLTATNDTLFRKGESTMASVRVSPTAIIDFAPRFGAEFISGMFGGEGSAGQRVHHVCLAMTSAELQTLRSRLEQAGVTISSPLPNALGARGPAAAAFYFLDPDGNVLEARAYA
jgi:catechol 2,3-dioxygenase-like lactoylglutathione lyase family enzyme